MAAVGSSITCTVCNHDLLTSSGMVNIGKHTMCKDCATSISALRKTFHKCTTHGINALRAVCPGTFTRDPKRAKDVMCFECILKSCNKDKARERVVMDVVLAPFKITLPRTSPVTSPLNSPLNSPQTPAQLEEELFGTAAVVTPAAASSCN